jgi:hypothetical protein
MHSCQSKALELTGVRLSVREEMPRKPMTREGQGKATPGRAELNLLQALLLL